MLGNVMPAPRFAALGIAPATTAAYLLRTVGYTVVFLLVRELTQRSHGRRRWTLFVPLIAIAAAEAALGLSQIAPNLPAHGTYGNRNHFAGLLEMVLPGTVALGLAIRGFAGIGVLCLATLIFLGILYSLSKMGFVAALGGLFIMAALGVGARLPRRTRWLAVAGIAAIVLAAFIFLPPDQVINGIGGVFADDATGEGRFPIWADSLHLLAAYPIFGVGLGNYGDAFVKYQTAVVDRTFDHAHNDYLELLADLGVFGYVLLAALVFLIFRKAAAAAKRSSDADIRYLGLGCAGAIAAIGLHSLTDYNMYIPANAFVFAWIAGIAAGLPTPSRKGRGSEKPIPSRADKVVFLALSGVLTVYASGWLVLQHSFLSDPQAESWFCRFGICNMNGYLFPVDPDTVRQAYVLESVRRYPASADRWSALGKAMWRSGQIEKARQCFSNAVALGPNRQGTLFTFADFYHSLGEDGLALEQTSRALQSTKELDHFFFDWFQQNKIPLSKVVSAGLPPDAAVFQSYLRYMLNSKNAQAAEQVWNASIARGYADEKLALEYVNFLGGQNRFESAARAWAAYLGDRRNGYLESNWLWNGDFESEPNDSPLNWGAWSGGGVEAARDADVKHSGAYSLRIRFEGKQNVTDAHVGQGAFVTPGRYRFEAYLKSQELTTDQGISLQIFDATGASHLNVKTEPLLGTHDWTKVDLNVCVPPQTKWIQIRVVRQPSLKFDNLIKGTLWLDSVSLKKVGQNCAV
jgi:O-antigen ligase/tetratricopeptide (TPR) repeat protein